MTDPKLPTDTEAEEEVLASPTELAGSTEGAINAEFAARDAVAAANDDHAEDVPPDGE